MTTSANRLGEQKEKYLKKMDLYYLLAVINIHQCI